MRPDKKNKPYNGKTKETVQENPKKEKVKPVSVPVQPVIPELVPRMPLPSVGTIPAASGTQSHETDETLQQKTETKSDQQLVIGSVKYAYSKRKVFSNWERYAEPERVVELEDEDNEGLDFEKLLQAPVTAEGHFVFKSEKIEPPPSGNLFALDLKILSEGLKQIPFYKQLELPQSYFTADEIKAMDQQDVSSYIPQHLKEPVPQRLQSTSSAHVLPEQAKSLQPSAPRNDAVQPANQLASHSSSKPQTEAVVSSVLASLPKPVSSVTDPVPCAAETTEVPVERSKSAEVPKTQREKKPRKFDLVTPSSQEESEAFKNKAVSSSTDTISSNLISMPGDCKSLIVGPQIVAETILAVPKPTNDPPASKPDDDLEAWLDSVLED